MLAELRIVSLISLANFGPVLEGTGQEQKEVKKQEQQGKKQEPYGK